MLDKGKKKHHQGGTRTPKTTPGRKKDPKVQPDPNKSDEIDISRIRPRYRSIGEPIGGMSPDLVAQLILSPWPISSLILDEGALGIEADTEEDEHLVVLRRRGVVFSAEIFDVETGVRLIRENVVSSIPHPSAGRASDLWQELAHKVIGNDLIMGSAGAFSVFDESDPYVIADFTVPFEAEGIHQWTRTDLAGPAE